MRSFTGIEAIKRAEAVMMGFNAIKDYLRHIQVGLLSEEMQEHEMINPKTLDRNRVYTLVLKCEIEKDLFEHFDGIARLDSIQRYPKINEENVYSNANSISLRDFSIFEYDEVARFELPIQAASEADINEQMFILKTKTEPIVYKRFSQDFDNQVEDELGE